MSIYLGNVKISGNAKVVALPMFFATYQPRKLNNASWLRAEPYSWHSADVYVSAYAHLADNISGVTAETETIAGTTITFYRLSDEIKVVLPDQETNLDTIYNATGIGYYFVLDTTNRQFKLPRNIYGFTGYRGDVGGYVAESLPNITGYTNIDSNTGPSYVGGAFKTITSTGVYVFSGGSGTNKLTFDASLSNSTYQNDAPVQQRATQAYLYFYVGNTIQDQTTIAVGEITEDLNGKADIDLGNLSNAGKIVASGLGMPSSSYDDLTLGATGANYTAPADGYFFLHKSSGTVASAYLVAYGGVSDYYDIQWGPNFAADDLSLIVPAKSGDSITIGYSANGTTKEFRFIYAEGSKSLA